MPESPEYGHPHGFSIETQDKLLKDTLRHVEEWNDKVTREAIEKEGITCDAELYEKTMPGSPECDHPHGFSIETQDKLLKDAWRHMEEWNDKDTREAIEKKESHAVSHRGRIPKLKNRRMPGQTFHNVASGQRVFVPVGCKAAVVISTAYNVPRRFVVFVNDDAFCVSVPECEFLNEADVSCAICGDEPSPGRALLDRDLPWERKLSCMRCNPDYLCMPCRVEIDACCFEPPARARGGWAVCLACLEPGEYSLLHDKRRLRALEAWWELGDELSL